MSNYLFKDIVTRF